MPRIVLSTGECMVQCIAGECGYWRRCLSALDSASHGRSERVFLLRIRCEILHY